MKILFSVILSGLLATLNGQGLVLKGNVFDSLGQPVPFVNIGLTDHNVGTFSQPDGHFRLSLPDSIETGTLVFSHVGYEEIKITIGSEAIDFQTIYLTKAKTQLSEVTIDAKKSKLKTQGTKLWNPIIFTNVVSPDQLDIIEFGKRINTDRPILLKKAAIYLKHVRLDSASIRLNFYEVADESPGKRIIYSEVLIKDKVEKGWFEIDLSEYDIEINRDFFIGFEYLPTNQKLDIRYINYGARFGSNLYTRNASLGKWTEAQGVTLTAYVEYWE